MVVDKYPIGRRFRLWSVLFPVRQRRRLYLFRVAWLSLRPDRRGCRTAYEVSAALQLEPRDLWVGCYWTRSDYGKVLVYLCLLPCVPLRLHFKRNYGSGGVA